MLVRSRRLAPVLFCAAAGLAAFSSAAAQDVSEERTALQQRVDRLVPHQGFPGALSPENLEKERPAPPVDFTGTWFINLYEGMDMYPFGPPYPEFYEEGQKALKEGEEARARGETYRDVIGRCYPPGMPMIMTRFWAHNFIQLPTAIFMISGFNNSVRTIFLDGRRHSDPDLVVFSYNGESIGHWEGKTLVVDTRYFEPENHYIDNGIPISDEFHIVERFDLIDDGNIMQVEYIMTDPQMWKGEWRVTKRFFRLDDADINEAACILENNRHLPGTELGGEAAGERGQTELEASSSE